MMTEQESLAAPPQPSSSTWTDIFFDPARAFESLRDRPRFLVAAMVIAVATLTYSLFLVQRIGLETIVRAQIEAAPQTSSIEPQQKEQIIQQQLSPASRSFGFALQVLWMIAFFSGGAGLYWLGSMLSVRRISYSQALSIWIYSSLPPTLLMIAANTVLLLLTPPDEIDAAKTVGHGGLVYATPSVWVDAALHPVMATAAGAVDLFSCYALFLAALGLRKVAGTSTGAACGIVLAIWLLGVLVRVVFAAVTGTAVG
jgi:hypothetical protein